MVGIDLPQIERTRGVLTRGYRSQMYLIVIGKGLVCPQTIGDKYAVLCKPSTPLLLQMPGFNLVKARGRKVSILCFINCGKNSNLLITDTGRVKNFSHFSSQTLL